MTRRSDSGCSESRSRSLGIRIAITETVPALFVWFGSGQQLAVVRGGWVQSPHDQVAGIARSAGSPRRCRPSRHLRLGLQSQGRRFTGSDLSGSHFSESWLTDASSAMEPEVSSNRMMGSGLGVLAVNFVESNFGDTRTSFLPQHIPDVLPIETRQESRMPL
jgi:hypothetical protein